jgi:hypothetical protein
MAAHTFPWRVRSIRTFGLEITAVAKGPDGLNVTVRFRHAQLPIDPESIKSSVGVRYLQIAQQPITSPVPPDLGGLAFINRERQRAFRSRRERYRGCD